MIKFFLFFMFLISVVSAQPSIEIKKSLVWKEIETYILENNQKINSLKLKGLNIEIAFSENSKFIFKEKAYYMKKGQERVFLKRYLKGYLSAKYFNEVELLPYAYAFIIKHTENQAFEYFYQNNQFENWINTKKTGVKTEILFHNQSFSFYKIKDNQYDVSVSYYLTSTNNKFYVNNLLKVKIENNPFNFIVYEEHENIKKID